MSYEGGGGAQGPAGPTGPTGPSGGPIGPTGATGLRGPTGANGATGATGANGVTGGISFSGPFGSILWCNETGVTGVTGLRWENNGPGGYVMYGADTNYISFDDGTGSMNMFISQTDAGHGILLSAGNTQISLTDAVTGESPVAGQLQVTINGNPGLGGQVLTSDGTITTWQTLPNPSVTLVEGILDLYEGGDVMLWTPDATGFYADFTLSQPVYSNSNVIVTMINTASGIAVASWIMNVTPNDDGENNLRIYVAALPLGQIYASYLITNPGSAPPP